MYKISNFYIPVELEQEGKVALFHTVTSSVIKMTPKMYRQIFLDHDFRTEPYILQSLTDMGYLVQENADEKFRLTAIRRQYQYASDGIKSAIIAVTTECNARCYYCYENGIARKPMTFETADGIINFLSRHCTTKRIVIQWFGGEPLCAADIIDYITSGLKKNGIQVSSLITTNGYLINEDILAKARDSWNLKRFQIPVDALGSEYNRIKNYIDLPAGEDAFTHLMEVIHLTLDHGFHVNVRTNFDPRNIQPTKDVLKYMAEEFANEKRLFVYPAPITGVGVPSVVDFACENGIHPYLDLLKYARDLGFFCPTLLKEESYLEGDEALSGISLASRPTGCYATLMNVFAIDSLGDLYKCHRLLGRGKQYTCGNVFDGVAYNHVLEQFCDDTPCYEECSSCALFPLCHGGCKVKKEWYHGFNGCMAIKGIVKDVVKIYVEELSKKRT